MYLRYIAHKGAEGHCLCSQDLLQFSVPRVLTELGELALMPFDHSTWNMLQKDLKLSKLVSFGVFKSMIEETTSMLQYSLCCGEVLFTCVEDGDEACCISMLYTVYCLFKNAV